MFGLFSKKKASLLIDEEMRVWLEEAFLWLIEEFDPDKFQKRKVFLPTETDFPIQYDGSREAGQATLVIVTSAMDIDPAEVEINYFQSPKREFVLDSGSIFTQQGQNVQNPLGLYFGREENGKYLISLDESLLNKPEELLSTLVHELCHLKLLGEGRISENDEYLTDLLTVVFGFGIFNANAAFQFKKSFDSWSYQSAGYLNQMEWGYALALFAFYRNEEKPSWLSYLNKTVQSDVKLSLQYLKENPPKALLSKPNEE